MIGDLSDPSGPAVGKTSPINPLNPSGNTTEAPTNAATINNVLPNGLTEIELDFVTLIDQHYSLVGEVPTAEKAYDLWNISDDQFTSLLNSSSVNAALKERGIDLTRILKFSADPTDSSVEQWRSKALTPIQLIAANTVLDLTDQRSDKKKLQDIGVSTAQFNRWLKDPVFNSYLRERAESLLGDSQHEASLALLDKVKAGDLGAIKFYMEYTGRYTTVADKAAAKATSSDPNEMQMLMVRLLEIITEECDGPTAFRIAQRVKEATAIHKMAIDITQAEIVEPEVAPMRVLTPELQALSEQTGGEL